MLKILVIDDEAAIRQVLGAFLKRLGHQTDEAGNLADAKSILSKQSDYDLIITDILLPDGKSLELISKVKSTMPKVKVIAITGDSPMDGGESLLALADDAGADLSFSKPFSLLDIKEKVEKLFNV